MKNERVWLVMRDGKRVISQAFRSWDTADAWLVEHYPNTCFKMEIQPFDLVPVKAAKRKAKVRK